MLSQGTAETDQVVKVGLKLFHELGERTRRTQSEVQVYREALGQLASRSGVELPAFWTEDGGGGEFDPDKMREWLSVVLPGPLAREDERTGSGRGRGGGSRSRGKAAGSRVKRPRGTDEGDGVEGRRPNTG